MEKYIGTKEAAALLNLSMRRVVGLCQAGEFQGAVQKNDGRSL